MTLLKGRGSCAATTALISFFLRASTVVLLVEATGTFLQIRWRQLASSKRRREGKRTHLDQEAAAEDEASEFFEPLEDEPDEPLTAPMRFASRRFERFLGGLRMADEVEPVSGSSSASTSSSRRRRPLKLEKPVEALEMVEVVGLTARCLPLALAAEPSLAIGRTAADVAGSTAAALRTTGSKSVPASSGFFSYQGEKGRRTG